MNTNKLYHIENFDSFNNIFTIYKKHVITYKRIIEDEEIENVINTGNKQYKIKSDYYKYIPVYGHYYNNNNLFICKKIQNGNVLDNIPPYNFLTIKDEEIARPYKGGIYIAKDIDDLYDLLEKLNNYEKENGTV